MTPQRSAARRQGCSIEPSWSLAPHAAMQKRVSHSLQNALDNGRNFAGDPAVLIPKSLIHRPISGPLERKRPCVFTTIATPT